MARTTVNNADVNVTFKPNIQGARSTVFSLRVPESLVYTVFDLSLLVMKLKKANGQEISPFSKILVSGIRPGKKEPVEICNFDYRPWSALDLSEQYDNNKNTMLKLRIPGGRVDLLELHELLIRVESEDLIDEDNSFFELEIHEAPFRP